MPAFTPQPHSITALWLVLILPSHRGQKNESTWDIWYLAGGVFNFLLCDQKFWVICPVFTFSDITYFIYLFF